MKSKSIKTILPKLSGAMILLFCIFILPLNVWVQLQMQHKSQRASVKELFDQLEHFLQTNEKELEREKQDFKERCIRSADVVALYTEHDQELIENIEHSQELAAKLEIDEIHFFTPEGKIFSGTNPEYYGYSFDSGKQMNYFKPMLQDRTLKLCQDIMPNTAEGKEMQYAAVWTQDGSGIVQVGVEPRRLQQEMEEKSLKNIVADFPFELNGYLHIADKTTQEVVASTKEELVGRDMSKEVQINCSDQGSNRFHQNYNGKRYCVYTKVYKDYILVRTYESSYPWSVVFNTSVLTAIYVFLGATIIAFIIGWYVQHRLIGNLNHIIGELKRVENGDMENIDQKTGITEFDELLFYINQMLNSIRLNWNKLSYILDKGKIPIGIYDKNRFYKQTFINERLVEIMGVPEQITVMEEKVAFIERELIQAERQEINQAEHICTYENNGEIKYLRIEKQQDEQSTVYYVTDMSPFWAEMNAIKGESEKDELTGLYNRRGFYQKIEILFEKKDKLGCAAMLMIDVDGLKQINDLEGHYMGDVYLKNISTSICKVAGEKAVCGRLGGDEFVAFLYGFSSIEELEKAIILMKNQRGKSMEQFQLCRKYTQQFSMGVAFYPLDGEDFHVLLQVADKKMYQEKRERKKA